MCNKYISFKENQNYSNFLPGKSNSIFLYLYIWLIFDLSRRPPSGKIRNTLSILTSLRNLRYVRKHFKLLVPVCNASRGEIFYFTTPW